MFIHPGDTCRGVDHLANLLHTMGLSRVLDCYNGLGEPDEDRIRELFEQAMREYCLYRDFLGVVRTNDSYARLPDYVKRVVPCP